MTTAMPRAIANGTAVPKPSSHAVSRRFSRPRTLRTWAPDTNMRNIRPSWYTNPSPTVRGIALAGADPEEASGDVGSDLSEDGRPENHPGQDLADHLRLSQLREEVPQQCGARQEDHDRERELTQFLVRHFVPPWFTTTRSRMRSEQVRKTTVVRLEVVPEPGVVSGIDRRTIVVSVMASELTSPLVGAQAEELEDARRR